jgi:hypothetical protein
MLAELKQLIINAGITYPVTYEEAMFYNAIDTDEKLTDTYHILIEEFVNADLIRDKGSFMETVKAQVYFFYIPEKIATSDTTAEEREAKREELKDNGVYPLADKLRYEGANQTKTFRISYPIPRFDCEEIGVLLEFDWKKPVCKNTFS